MKVRAAAFSRQAAGALPSGLSTRRTKFGQLVARAAAGVDPATPAQLTNRIKLTASVGLWRSLPNLDYQTYTWDRLRRYERRGGTGFARFIGSYVSILNRSTIARILYDPSVVHLGFINWLSFRVNVPVPSAIQTVSYGLTPVHRSTVVLLNPLGAGLWGVEVAGVDPSKRYWARFASCELPSTVTGETGLVATT